MNIRKKHKIHTLKLGFLIPFLLTSFFVSSQSNQSDFKIPPPKNLPDSNKVILWATQYYIHQMSSGFNISFKDVNGNSLGLYADTCNFCDAALEGTAFIKDSTGKITVLNFEKTGDTSFVNCRNCKKFSATKLNVESWGKALWRVSSGYGDGVKNYKLIPYRTIAVDNTFIPYGSVIYISLAKGKMIELPNGQKVEHDGYFFAGDTGGAISENHIDIFTGICLENPFPEIITSDSSKTFEAFLIQDINCITYLKALQTK